MASITADALTDMPREIDAIASLMRLNPSASDRVSGLIHTVRRPSTAELASWSSPICSIAVTYREMARGSVETAPILSVCHVLWQNSEQKSDDGEDPRGLPHWWHPVAESMAEMMSVMTRPFWTVALRR